MKVKLSEQDTPLLWTVHFLSGSGGWWDLRRGHEKKYGYKGRGSKKHSGFKEGGGGTKKLLKILQ